MVEAVFPPSVSLFATTVCTTYSSAVYATCDDYVDYPTSDAADHATYSSDYLASNHIDCCATYYCRGGSEDDGDLLWLGWCQLQQRLWTQWSWLLDGDLMAGMVPTTTATWDPISGGPNAMPGDGPSTAKP